MWSDGLLNVGHDPFADTLQFKDIIYDINAVLYYNYLKGNIQLSLLILDGNELLVLILTILEYVLCILNC